MATSRKPVPLGLRVLDLAMCLDRIWVLASEGDVAAHVAWASRHLDLLKDGFVALEQGERRPSSNAVAGHKLLKEVLALNVVKQEPH